ncbi:acylphosphatase-2-like [Uloborus diversus]|uniref:acylphosphatase-2-like n=1 Tax=Uloborus diversus TaxID=327109 RepID=UPI00240A1900|nr:acylphosphatase-2-like [Uloborus diversus]
MRGREIIVWRYPKRIWQEDPFAMMVLTQVNFEVFGYLHGVNFIQHAKEIADRLGVRGWIRITRYGTAMGQIQGEKDRVEEMALWLRHTGSPGCRIEFVAYQNWKVIDGFEYRKFNARV